MDDAIVPLDSLALTALVHRDTKWRRTFWEATCPELSITVPNSSHAAALDWFCDSLNPTHDTNA